MGWGEERIWSCEIGLDVVSSWFGGMWWEERGQLVGYGCCCLPLIGGPQWVLDYRNAALGKGSMYMSLSNNIQKILCTIAAQWKLTSEWRKH